MSKDKYIYIIKDNQIPVTHEMQQFTTENNKNSQNLKRQRELIQKPSTQTRKL